MKVLSLRCLHTFFVLCLFGQTSHAQTIFNLDPPIRLNGERTISKVKISRSVNQRDTVIFLEEGRSTLVVDFTSGLYYLYRRYTDSIVGHAEPVGSSFVGSETQLTPLFAHNLIFKFDRPIVVPLHWGKTITFDSIEMMGGPYSPLQEQRLTLGNVRNGIFVPLEDVQQLNSRGNTMFFSHENLGLAAYIADGKNSQGIFFEQRYSLGNSYAKIVSVPYSGGPPDFPPFETLVRTTTHFIAESDPKELIVPARACVRVLR